MDFFFFHSIIALSLLNALCGSLPTKSPSDLTTLSSEQLASGMMIKAQTKIDTNFVQRMVPSKYDRREPPPGLEDPLIIQMNFSVFILGFTEFKEELNIFKLQMKLFSEWIDPRLDTSAYLKSGIHPFIPRKDQDNIWTPTLAFYDVQEGIIKDTPLDYPWMEVLPATKGILRRQTIDFKVSCEMDLQMYPMDTQICTLDFRPLQPEEFGKFIVPKWGLLADKSQTREDFQMNVFSFKMVNASKDVLLLFDARTNISRPLLRMIFQFERQLLPKFVSLYLPSLLVVTTTFVSFWVDNQAVPGRVALVITSVLTLIQLLISSRKDLPPVNLVTAIDVWLITCLAFACFALFEFALSYTITLRQNKMKAMDERKRSSGSYGFYQVSSPITTRSNHKLSVSGSGPPPAWLLHKRRVTIKERSKCYLCFVKVQKSLFKPIFGCLKKYLASKSVDDISKFLFPFSFVTFSIVYFLIYI